MYYVSHILTCAILCLAILDRGQTAENSVIAKNYTVSLAPNVRHILTPFLIKEIERNIPNDTKSGISDILAISEDLSTTPTPQDVISTTSRPKSMKNYRGPSSTTRKPRTTGPTTILFPAGKVNAEIHPGPELAGLIGPVGLKRGMAEDDTGFDTARAQQRQLENQFPYDFRTNFGSNFDSGFQGSGRQLNGDAFEGQDLFNAGVLRPFDSLDGRPADIGTTGINSQFPGRDSTFSGRPYNAPGSSLDFDRFQDFSRFGYDGRFQGSNRYFDPNFRAGLDRVNNFAQQNPGISSVGSFGGQQDPRVSPAGSFSGQQDPRVNLAQNYRQDFRNIQNPTINPSINPLINPSNNPANNPAINPSINSQTNDQGVQRLAGVQGVQGLQGLSGLEGYRPVSNPPFPQNYGQNFDPSYQRFQNPFYDGRNPAGLNYSPYFPSSAITPGPVAPIGSTNTNDNKDDNNSGVAQSLTSSRRSEDSATRPGANVEKVASTIPGVESLQDRLDLERLFYPALDDYSDVRGSSGIFKQHLLASNIIEKYAKTNVV